MLAFRHWVRESFQVGLLLSASHLPHAAAQMANAPASRQSLPTEEPVVAHQQEITQMPEEAKRAILLIAKIQYPETSLLDVLLDQESRFAHIRDAMGLSPDSEEKEITRNDSLLREEFAEIKLKDLNTSADESVRSSIEEQIVKRLEEARDRKISEFKKEGLNYGQALDRASSSVFLREYIRDETLETLKGYNNPAVNTHIDAIPLSDLITEEGWVTNKQFQEKIITKLPVITIFHSSMEQTISGRINGEYRKKILLVQNSLLSDTQELSSTEPMRGYLQEHTIDYFVSALEKKAPEEQANKLKKEIREKKTQTEQNMSTEELGSRIRNGSSLFQTLGELPPWHPLLKAMQEHPSFRLAEKLRPFASMENTSDLGPNFASVLSKMKLPLAELTSEGWLDDKKIQEWSQNLLEDLKEVRLSELAGGGKHSFYKAIFGLSVKNALIDQNPYLSAVFLGAEGENQKCKDALEHTSLKAVLGGDTLRLDDGKAYILTESVFPPDERAAFTIRHKHNPWREIQPEGSAITRLPVSFNLEKNTRSPSYVTNPSEMTPEQQAIMQYAMSQYSRFLPLNFEYKEQLPLHAGKPFGILNYNAPLHPDFAGIAIGWNNKHQQIDLAIDMAKSNHYKDKAALLGTNLHEAGHALGLAHPHNASHSSKLPGTKEEYVPELNKSHTIMSYTHVYNGSTSLNTISPSPGDVIATREMYGTRKVNPGNTTYTIKDTNTLEEAMKHPEANRIIPGYVQTIVDDGGINSLDARGVKGQINVDLASTHSPKLTENTSLGVVGTLHHATARHGIIKGNEKNNRIEVIESGFLNGKGGDDLLVSGHRGSTMLGGDGKDTFQIQSGAGTDYIVDYEKGEKIIAPEGTAKVTTSKEITIGNRHERELHFLNNPGKLLKSVGVTFSGSTREINIRDQSGKQIPVTPQTDTLLKR